MSTTFTLASLEMEAITLGYFRKMEWPVDATTGIFLFLWGIFGPSLHVWILGSLLSFCVSVPASSMAHISLCI